MLTRPQPPTIISMPISPARAAAFDILLRVERDGSYTSELLHSPTYDHLSKPDHALATELTMGVLRWRSSLDDEIAQASSQPLAKLDLQVLIALRIALYQFRHLDRIPHRAALNESVELVKRARKRSAASFVNAVLRKLSTRRPQAENLETPVSLARALAHPLWLVERWISQYGPAAAQAICRHNQTIPTTTIRLRAPTAEAELIREKIALTPGALLTSARYAAADITATSAFRTGQFVIQDEASQLVAALVGEFVGERSGIPENILDCCAAPGGKTLAIADRNPDAAITAVELYPHRARLLQSLLRTAHSSRINVIAADSRHLPLTLRYGRILADVPCSGTGTLARNPEIKWRLTAADLLDLQSRQRAILRAALAQAAPGGKVIYSTCSLEKEENEDVIENILEERSARVLDCRLALDGLKAAGELIWPDPANLTRGPYLRTIPGVHPCDGFFAAILQKL